MCAKTKLPPTSLQLEHAIKRNFGGLEEDFKPFDVFIKKISHIGSRPADRDSGEVKI